jgi:hypothetical protein
MDIIVSSAKIMGAFNTAFHTGNLLRHTIREAVIMLLLDEPIVFHLSVGSLCTSMEPRLGCEIRERRFSVSKEASRFRPGPRGMTLPSGSMGERSFGIQTRGHNSTERNIGHDSLFPIAPLPEHLPSLTPAFQSEL